MNPVVHEVSEQREEAHSDRPGVVDDCSSERAIFSSEQFTNHYKTWSAYSLATNRNVSIRYLAFCNHFTLDVKPRYFYSQRYYYYYYYYYYAKASSQHHWVSDAWLYSIPTKVNLLRFGSLW